MKDMIGSFHPLLGIMLLVCVKLLFKVEKLLNKLNIFYAPKDFGRGSGHTADKQQHTAQLNIIWKIFSNNIPYPYLQSIFLCSSYSGIDLLLIPGFEYLENGAGKAAVGFSVDMTTRPFVFHHFYST